MNINNLHRWDLSPSEAAELQREFAARIDVTRPLPRCELVAGADVSYNRFSNTIYAAVVVIKVADGSIVETAGAIHETTFPYIPGFLSFREAPALLLAFGKLQTTPNAVMFDGQGIAHPRRLGIASHMGLWLQVPCIGCAKSLLTGKFQEPNKAAGSTSPLLDKQAVIGQVVRTKTAVQPVYVSAGHLIDLPSAVRVVLETCRGYRLPEPTRQAHLHINEMRRNAGPPQTLH
ncbi:MAG: deoxyribonuclease V [Planctomycetia bacterium]|nr:deoxyribonuclease V [Planctomycetia bacterium]